MSDVLLTTREAAEYLKLPLPYLRHQIKHGYGPKFVRPSKRTKFFATEDLDAWRSTWTQGNGNGHCELQEQL